MLKISSHDVLARARKASDPAILHFGAGTAIGAGTYMTIRGIREPGVKSMMQLAASGGGLFLALKGKTDLVKKIGVGISGGSFLAGGGVLPGAAFIYGLIKNLGR